jgi:hypothetical protein
MQIWLAIGFQFSIQLENLLHLKHNILQLWSLGLTKFLDIKNHNMETATSLKSGVVYGQELSHLLRHANENGYALPAVNVISSHTVNGVPFEYDELGNKKIIVPKPKTIEWSNDNEKVFVLAAERRAHREREGDI